MVFLITAITKVDRAGYDDVYWAGAEIVKVEAAPVDAFFDIETLVAGERKVFEAEVRKGKFLQVEWSDEFQDLLMEHSKSEEDWGRLAEAIVNVHASEPLGLPIKIGEELDMNGEA